MWCCIELKAVLFLSKDGTQACSSSPGTTLVMVMFKSLLATTQLSCAELITQTRAHGCALSEPLPSGRSSLSGVLFRTECKPNAPFLPALTRSFKAPVLSPCLPLALQHHDSFQPAWMQKEQIQNWLSCCSLTQYILTEALDYRHLKERNRNI